jgi:hypothetical protein
VRYHFIREAVEDGKVAMVYIPADEKPADIFTEPLSKAKFRQFVKLLGFQPVEEEAGSKKNVLHITRR